jgi:hypothetical protein
MYLKHYLFIFLFFTYTTSFSKVVSCGLLLKPSSKIDWFLHKIQSNYPVKQNLPLFAKGTKPWFHFKQNSNSDYVDNLNKKFSQIEELSIHINNNENYFSRIHSLLEATEQLHLLPTFEALFNYVEKQRPSRFSTWINAQKISTKSLPESINIPGVEINYIGRNWEVVIPLRQLLPAIARDKTGHWPEKNCSSNCWNSALNWFQLVDKIEILPDPNEMQRFLNNHFQKLKKYSSPQFGDVMAFRDRSRDKDGYSRPIPTNKNSFLLHTAIVLNSDYIWHKPSIENYEGWQFQYLKRQLQTYEAELDNIQIEFYRFKNKSF